ncbi:MAG: hypothetical protein QME62_08780, partial [Armatimonadota bacterium]|nr:hypothetical protein [Armatimonadota bacterium]
MIKQYTLSLVPLTPIHVGTGEVINPGDYFIFPREEDDKKAKTIYVCDLARIPAEELEPYRKKLLSWIQGNPTTWVSNVWMERGLVDLIKTHTKYKCKISENC